MVTSYPESTSSLSTTTDQDSTDHDVIIATTESSISKETSSSTVSSVSPTTQTIEPGSTSSGIVTESISYLPPVNNTVSTTTAATITVSTSSEIECIQEGFFPDPEDCRKFYRCVGSMSSSVVLVLLGIQLFKVVITIISLLVVMDLRSLRNQIHLKMKLIAILVNQVHHKQKVYHRTAQHLLY